jgi:hypothetical protein
MDGDGAVTILGKSKLHRLFAGGPGLPLIDVGDAAGKAALQIAEGVAAHPLQTQRVLDRLGQIVGQRAAAQFDIAMGILLARRQAVGDGRALRIGHAFRDGHHTAAMPLHIALHIREEGFDPESPFGQIDQVRPVIRCCFGQAPPQR